MRGKVLLYSYLILGFLEIILTINEFDTYLVLHPVCVILIYSYHYKLTKSHNFYLLFFLACELVNEIFFLLDFRFYFELVLFCYSLATFTMIYHLWPLWNRPAGKLELDILMGPILGIVGMLIIFWELLLMIFEKIPNYPVFFLGLLALLSWILFCTTTPIKNNHPLSSTMYLLGGLMAIMAPTMFIYSFLFEHSSILALCLLSMLILKWIIAVFLTRKDKILKTVDEFLEN